MKKLKFILVSSLVLLSLTYTQAATNEPSSAGLQSSNLLNPNISAIGWFQAEAGHRDPRTQDPDEDALQLKEIELAFQAVVDPYSRADIIVSVTPDETEIEEGTLSWFALPGGLALKAGKFKNNFGRFNRIHTGETAFADRPLVHQNFFADEGLAGTGGSVSWQIPNPLLLVNLDLEAVTAPDEEEGVAFLRSEKKELLYVGRFGGYLDLTEASNVSFGSSLAMGPAGESLDPITNSSTTLRSRVAGLDLTFRWKNPRRAIYRSFTWNTEALFSDRDISADDAENAWGLFSHFEYQFARQWRTGGRYDYTESPLDRSDTSKGGLVYLTFMPSEFNRISLQGKHVTLFDGTHEDLVFLKTTFNIGPHGAHPF